MALSQYLKDKGYTLVEEECPECRWGQLVTSGDGRTFCTAYGSCELAPG